MPPQAQDFCVDLRDENIHAIGVKGSSIYEARNAVRPILHSNGLLPAIPKNETTNTSAAWLLEMAWQEIFRGLPPMSANLEEAYMSGASLYASIDSESKVPAIVVVFD